MIELADAQKSQSRLFALGITILCLLAGYLIMAFWQVEAPMQQLEIYERLEWFKFTPVPTPRKLKKPKKDASKKQKRSEAKPVSKPTVPRKVDLDIEKLTEVLKVDLSTAISASRPKAKAPNAPVSGIEKIKIEELLPELNQTRVLKGEGPSLPIPGGHLGKSAGTKTPGLAIEEVRMPTLGNQLESLDKTGQLLTGIQGKSTDLPEQEISLLDLSKLGSDYSNISPIFKALVEWMKRHPGKHPPAIISLTRQGQRTQDALRSVVRFRVNGRVYTLYLKVIESLYEVHIVLIEGTHLSYLIDSGFKKRSHFLRIGRATYADTTMTQLIACDTSMEKPSDRRTKEFYQIFLSWWESVKSEVENDS